MKFSTALKLGRISNLPTVWTNVMVGTALVTSQSKTTTLILTAVAISLLYTAGMFLNDAFDREWDRENKNIRPLVTGEAKLQEVLWTSAILILAAIIILLSSIPTDRILLTASATFMLIALIMLYNWQHKRWSLSPWIMGACRFMVYVVAGSIVGDWNEQLLLGSLCLMTYIAGVTYLAQSEHKNALLTYWPVVLLLMPVAFLLYIGINTVVHMVSLLLVLAWLAWSISKFRSGANRRVPQGVSSLLAGIALVDATILSFLNQIILATAAITGFLLCLMIQRKVSAT